MKKSITQATNSCTVLKQRYCYNDLLGETNLEYNKTLIGK